MRQKWRLGKASERAEGVSVRRRGAKGEGAKGEEYGRGIEREEGRGGRGGGDGVPGLMRRGQS